MVRWMDGWLKEGERREGRKERGKKEGREGEGRKMAMPAYVPVLSNHLL